tara:strand:- start:1035 stop:1289 length:255 start_codon:yes stop_codon:yes gene_type:complete
LVSDSQTTNFLNDRGVSHNTPKLLAIGIAPRGIIAIGLVPMGLVSIGAVSMGVFTIGAVGMGLVNACLVGCGLVVYGIKTMGIN